MKEPSRRRTSSQETTSGSDPLVRRIRSFLNGKQFSRTTIPEEWCWWASKKLGEGWSDDQIMNHIDRRWREHSSLVIQSPPNDSPDLSKALVDVYEMSNSGATPAQCAVVYRSLYRQFPGEHWLQGWSEKWEKDGERWNEASGSAPATESDWV